MYYRQRRGGSWLSSQLLLSIRATLAVKVLHGEKRVEFRRVRPLLATGDEIVVYATSPISAIICKAVVEDVLADHPAVLWRRAGAQGGVSHDEVMKYYDGVDE